MRWTVVLALGGCDLAFPLDPVAAPDAAPDVALPATLPCEKAAAERRAVRASSTDYVPTAPRDWAVSLQLGTTVVQGDDSGSPQAIPFQGMMLGPRLAPDGLSMIVLEKDPAVPDVAHFRRYTSDPNHVWNTTVFETEVYNGQRDFAFTSAVSAPIIDDNRAVLDFGSGNVFVEFQPSPTQPPINERTWTERATYQLTTFALDPATTIQEPALSPDGLFLAFVATQDTSAPRIAIAHRDSTDQFFGPVSIFYTPPLEAKTPYITNGCSQLFYTDESGGVVVVEFPSS